MHANIKFVNYYTIIFPDLHLVIPHNSLAATSQMALQLQPARSKSLSSLVLGPHIFHIYSFSWQPHQPIFNYFPYIQILNAIYMLETPKLVFPTQTSLRYPRPIYLPVFFFLTSLLGCLKEVWNLANPKLNPWSPSCIFSSLSLPHLNWL